MNIVSFRPQRVSGLGRQLPPAVRGVAEQPVHCPRVSLGRHHY